MKKSLAILFCMLTFCCCKAESFKAFTVKFSGDTLSTYISFKILAGENLLSSFYLSKNIKYSLPNGKEKTLSPQDFYYFQFYNNGERLEFYSLTNFINDTKSRGFFHLINAHKNYLRVYEYYEKETNANIATTGGAVGASLAKGNFKKSYLIEREDGKIFFIFRKTFKKDLKNALTDNPALLKKVDETNYTYDDIPPIIEEYNSWYNMK